MQSLGGKGANQSIAIRKFYDGQVNFLAKVGNDETGKYLQNELRRNNIDTKFLLRSKNLKSGACLITINDEEKDNIIIVDKGSNGDICKDDVDLFLSESKKGDILLMQLEIPLDIVLYAFQKGKEKGMFNVLNPAPLNNDFNEEILKYVDLLIPNETEFMALTNIANLSIENIENEYQKLLQKYELSLLLTLGEKGSLYLSKNKKILFPSYKVDVLDTTAAGDTYVGAFLSKIAVSTPIKEAMEFATLASSITITRKGAADSIPTLKEVNDLYLRLK